MTDFKDRLELLKNWDAFENLIAEAKTEVSILRQKLEQRDLEVKTLTLQHRAQIEKLEDEIADKKADLERETEWFAEQMFEEYDGEKLTEEVHILRQQKEDMRKRIKFLTSSNVVRWEFWGIAIIVKKKK